MHLLCDLMFLSLAMVSCNGSLVQLAMLDERRKEKKEKRNPSPRKPSPKKKKENEKHAVRTDTTLGISIDHSTNSPSILQTQLLTHNQPTTQQSTLPHPLTLTLSSSPSCAASLSLSTSASPQPPPLTPPRLSHSPSTTSPPPPH